MISRKIISAAMCSIAICSFAHAELHSYWNPIRDGFQLKLELSKSVLKPGESIQTKLILLRKKNEEPKHVMWGIRLHENVQPGIISLGNNTWVPLFHQLAQGNLGKPLPKSTKVSRSRPLVAQFNLDESMFKPLVPGKYLYFVTYESKSYRLDGKKEEGLWAGKLTSNIVEFEVKE